MMNFFLIVGMLTTGVLVGHTIPGVLLLLLRGLRDWWIGYHRPLLDEEVHERMVKEFTEASVSLCAMSPPPEDMSKIAEKVYRDLIERYSKELSELTPGWWD